MVDLEFLQIYTMDLVMRWQYGRDGFVRKYSNRVDDFVYQVVEKCRANGVTFLLLSDHGYDATIGSVDVMQPVRSLGLAADEYTEFVEITCSRYWFHSERARQEIPRVLETIENVTVHEPDDFRAWGVEFGNTEWGELFCLTQPGYVFHPNDFYDPLGNFLLGLRDPLQRGRLTKVVTVLGRAMASSFHLLGD